MPPEHSQIIVPLVFFFFNYFGRKKKKDSWEGGAVRTRVGASLEILRRSVLPLFCLQCVMRQCYATGQHLWRAFLGVIVDADPWKILARTNSGGLAKNLLGQSTK